jgi:hypothetical protein
MGLAGTISNLHRMSLAVHSAQCLPVRRKRLPAKRLIRFSGYVDASSYVGLLRCCAPHEPPGMRFAMRTGPERSQQLLERRRVVVSL